MPSQTDNLLLDDDTSGLPRTINVASDDIVLSVDLTLQSGGILTADNIKRGTADPNVATLAGNEGDIYQRTLNDTGQLWVNTDGTTTGWALVASGVTLQSAYIGGNTITTSGGEGNVIITGTEDLVFTGSDLLVDATASFSIDSVASSNVSVTGAQLQLSTITSGELDLTAAGLMDINGAANIDIDVTGSFDMLSTGVFSIDGTGASNVSATSGNLTLSTITSGTLFVTSAGLLDVDAAANIDIDVTGTFDVLSTGVFSIDGTGASNVSATSGALTLSSITSGDVTIVGADAITLTAGNEAAATGNVILLTSGDGGGNNPGGAINITGGTGGGGGTSGIGGGLTFVAGTGGATGAGGAVSISGGTGGATSGNGGGITLRGGTATDGNGGAATLQGRDGVGTNRTGGLVQAVAGAATGSGSGGTAGLVGGAGGATGTAGSVFVTGGAGGSTSGAGADATIRGGAPIDGNGGGALVTGRDAATTTATNRNGGGVTISAGNAAVAGNGGVINITAGGGGATGTAGTLTITGGPGGSTSGAGGAVTVQGGTATDGNGGAATLAGRAGVGTDRTGGTASVTGGAATGTGTGGGVTITAGAAVNGSAGTVSITGGSGGTAGTAGFAQLVGGTGSATGAGATSQVLGGAGGATSGAGGLARIRGGTPTDGNGGGIEVTGQNAATTSATNRNGGAVTVVGGNPVLAGTGGSISLAAGTGGATGTAGTISITGGAGGSTSGAAGGVTIAGGTPVDGNGGGLTLTGSAGVGTNRNGGAIGGTAGNATGSGTGGSVTFTAGSGGATGTAGGMTLTAGAGGSSSGGAGSITLSGGTPVDGAGGGITLTATAGVGTNRAGGTVAATAGNATGNATGGAVNLTAGSGGATGTAGTITITTGAGGSSSGNAGNLVLTSGSVTSGARGVVRISNTALEIIEAASVPGPTIAATQGRFWVRNDAPNVPMFTDDTGVDHNLLSGGSSGPTDWKDSVRAATTGGIALSGELTIDGVSLVTGDRVLVKNQDGDIPSGSVVGSGDLLTDSTSFVDALCTSPALDAGDWFVIGLANFKNETADYYGEMMEARFGTTRFAYTAFRSLFGSFAPGNDAAGAPMMMCARVTSTGSETLNMRAAGRGNTPGDDILVGSQQWIYFSLDPLAENTDYWAAEGPNNDSAAVTPSGTTWTGDVQLSFTPTESGDYLIIAFAEGFNAGVATTNEYHARLRMNSTTIGTEVEYFISVEGDTTNYAPHFFNIDVRTLTASTPYTIGWEFRNASGNSGMSYRRQRVYAFRLAAFADSASAAIYDGMQPNNSTVECSTTLSHNLGTSVTTLVLGSLSYQNGGAFGQGWLRHDGTPDTDYPPNGRMWAYITGGLTSGSEIMPISFAALAVDSGTQVWRHVGDSNGAQTIAYGRAAGNAANSRMPMVALTMQTSAGPAQNGIYVVDTGAWSRSSDADSDAEVTSMLTVAVEEGTVNANTYWYLSTMNPIVVDTTALTFVQLGNSSGVGLTQAQVLARISLGV